MLYYILITIFYFILIFALGKISDKLNLQNWWVASLLLFFPPLYFLFLTKHFFFMFVISLISVFITYWLVSFWIYSFYIYLPILVPLVLASSLILYQLKADQRIALINLAPPFIWTIFFIYYLAFFYEVKDELKIEENN